MTGNLEIPDSDYSFTAAASSTASGCEGAGCEGPGAVGAPGPIEGAMTVPRRPTSADQPQRLDTLAK